MKNLRDVCNYIDEIWDTVLNAPLKPEDVSARSNKKYYWKCQNGHPSYLCSADKRFFGGCGCPVCSNHKVITGINDFESNNKELMLDWDYELNKDIDPSKLSVKSITRVNWKCHKCGNKWSGIIRDAVRKTINCPKCSKLDSAKKKHSTSLLSSGCIEDEVLLLDWDYEKNANIPENYTPYSNKKVSWKCHKCGYEWVTSVNNRSNGRKCPCCANKVLVRGINDLQTKKPEIAKEWHPTKNFPLTPEDFLPSVNKKVWWLCPQGHSYQATINHRTTVNGTNCPHCYKGNQTSFREQALYYYVKKVYPEAINGYRCKELGSFELDIYIPEIDTAIEYDGAAWHKEEKMEREERKYCICKKMGIKLIRVKEKMPKKWWADVADRIISGHTEKDFESLDEYEKMIHIVLAEITKWQKPYWINPIDVNLNRDKYEIMKYASKIKNSLADLYPNIASEWDPTKNGELKPSMFKPKSDFKAWWECPTCNFEYEATIGHRVDGTGCPKCGALRSIQKRSKKVAMVDLKTGNVLKIYESISEAGRQTKNSTGNITAVCKGKRPNAGGFYWKYADETDK